MLGAAEGTRGNAHIFRHGMLCLLVVGSIDAINDAILPSTKYDPSDETDKFHRPVPKAVPLGLPKVASFDDHCVITNESSRL